MKTNVTFSAVIVALAFAASALLYPRLPADMPVHWNMAGEVDGTMAKPWGAFVLPLVMLGTAAMLLILPALSPRGYEIEMRTRAFRATVFATLLFLLAVHLLALASAVGYRVSIPKVMPILLGALLAVLGNYLGKVPRNFFIGIRTPWTLADEDVWFSTHRLASKMFVCAGIVIAVAVPFAGEPATGVLVIGGTLAAAIVPAVYSFVIYKSSARGSE